MKVKICIGSCGKEKPLSEFYKSKRTKGGYKNICKQCLSIQHKEWRQNNLEHDKQVQKLWRQNNLERHKQMIKLWYQNNLERKKKTNRLWRQNNLERINHMTKLWYQNNLDRKRETNRLWRQKNRERINEDVRKRRNIDIQFKLSKSLRSRLKSAIKYNQKVGSAVRDLGCSIEDLKKYLESSFQPGMTWDNYGQFGWHIDHIKPLYGFDLTNREQLLEACHYTNLQPLWWRENLSKGARILR